MRRQAFTLLEIIIALGILAGALAVLVEVSRLSMQNARRAALETDAARIAESVLGELESGAAELASYSGEWLDHEQQPADWLYEVMVDSSAIQGLLSVSVTVIENIPEEDGPTRFTLVRWLQDPTYLAQFESADEEGA